MSKFTELLTKIFGSKNKKNGGETCEKCTPKFNLEVEEPIIKKVVVEEPKLDVKVEKTKVNIPKNEFTNQPNIKKPVLVKNPVRKKVIETPIDQVKIDNTTPKKKYNKKKNKPKDK
jgi:hypothetical protein